MLDQIKFKSYSIAVNRTLNNFKNPVSFFHIGLIYVITWGTVFKT